MILSDDTPIDSDFEQWKKDHPYTYEILFSLLLRWADICKGIHGYDKVAHMWQHHTNLTKRWSPVSLHVATHVTKYRISSIYLNSIARKFALAVELDFINGLGEIMRSDYISDLIEEDIICDIEDEVTKYLTNKSAIEAKETDCEEDKPIYKKPGVIYQHASTANHGSTETQNAIERILKDSFYGINAISPLNGKAYFAAGESYWDLIYQDLLNKEKENIKMKKIIINHYAVIVMFGKKDAAGKPVKTVVKILDPDTKEERGPWNTKLAVVSAIAKSFEHARDGKHSTCYKLYEMLNTIKKPTNDTIDFVANEMYQDGKRLKCCKWYQEAIKVKRPEPGKQVEIVIG